LKNAACCVLLVLLCTGCFGEIIDVPEFVEVQMTATRFVPDTVRVLKGTAVRWVNNDTVPHNTQGAFWTSPNLIPGRSFDERMHHGGPYEYRCTLHEHERGVVIVR
jgi:plastocyanin